MSEEQLATLKARRARHVALVNADAVPVLTDVAKPGKYRNKSCTYLEMKFDSEGERDRYIALDMLQRCGQISELRRQVAFSLHVNGMHVGKYLADFVYSQKEKRVVEDFKGLKTDLYVLKRKLMEAIYGIVIHETERTVRRHSTP